MAPVTCTAAAAITCHSTSNSLPELARELIMNEVVSTNHGKKQSIGERIQCSGLAEKLHGLTEKLHSIGHSKNDESNSRSRSGTCKWMSKGFQRIDQEYAQTTLSLCFSPETRLIRLCLFPREFIHSSNDVHYANF